MRHFVYDDRMKRLASLIASITVAALPFMAAAGPKRPTPPAPAAAEAPQQPQIPWQQGPKKIPLGHQLTLDLPAEHLYLNPRDAKKLLEKSGNFMDDSFLGMVIANDDTGKSDWWVAIEYTDEGYIKDDEKIDGNELLKSMKEGNEEANKMKAEKGFPPLFLDGWSEPPRYDKALHHVVWGIDVHSERGKSVNFNTRVLGRKGVVSLNLITSPEHLAAGKPEVEKLLQATTFDTGARYADFNSKTDKVATYGLAALIAGGAGVAALKIAKVGIFGKFLLPFFAKFFKLIAIAFIALGAFIKKLFSGKSDPTPPPPSSPPPGGESV